MDEQTHDGTHLQGEVGGDDGPLPAGDFATWLGELQDALRGERDADVLCGGCTACCTSSQFVHIEPDEHDALAHIPKELLFPAPFRPRGHVLLGYDERGHCPMLGDGGCSIYEHRPRTCRTYDCRVFPATGLVPDGDQVAIARRTRRWRFGFPAPVDRALLESVLAAARHLAEHPDELPAAAAASVTQRAVLAIELHDLFLGKEVDPVAVRVELRRRAG